jgi:hypothetical protein
MKLAFTIDGSLCATNDAADAYENDENFVVVDHDSDYDLWRYSYDHENSTVVVAYGTSTDEEALAQLEADNSVE